MCRSVSPGLSSLFPSLVSLSLSHLSCRSCSRAAFALALSLINWSLLRGRYCRGNLLEWCPGLIRLICTCVIEDTINNRTCWNGVLPSLFVSLSLGRLLFLSRAIFDPSLISRSLSLSLSRARAHSCSKAHLHLCPRGHHWHPNLLEWCPAVTLCHRLFPSPALSLCLCLCPSLFQVCLRLVLPGARRTARSNTCHAGLARSPVGAAPAQQAVQRCARTAGCAALLSHATMAQGPSQTDLAQRALLGASPPWSCQRGAGRPAPDSRGPPPP